jgi:hypothetical protein
LLMIRAYRRSHSLIAAVSSVGSGTWLGIILRSNSDPCASDATSEPYCDSNPKFDA